MFFGIEELLEGDHTDGHTDTLVRFARPGLVITEAPSGRNDPNAKARDDVARRLDGVRDAQGQVIDVVRIPGAKQRHDAEQGVLPATHTNYVFGPGSVIVPLYGGPEDADFGRSVLEAFAEIFPERDVIGLSCQAILAGGGGFHCGTCEAPAGVMGPWAN